MGLRFCLRTQDSFSTQKKSYKTFAKKYFFSKKMTVYFKKNNRILKKKLLVHKNQLCKKKSEDLIATLLITALRTSVK